MSADGYGFARKSHDLPVIRVIGSVAADAAADARNRIVWVIGTPLSINSGLYHETISRLDSIIVIYQRDFRLEPIYNYYTGGSVKKFAA
jgi:glutamate racemase